MGFIPTEEQQKIISHEITRDGLVLAGPGTGKSATVIQMMLRIARDGSGQGKLLTFTRSATNELKEKVIEHSEVLGKPSTMHSFSIATILANPETCDLPEPIRIADTWEWKELIREHLKELVGCKVREIDDASAEMASNWESLKPLKDPKLPESIRNQFTGNWDKHRALLGYSLLAELPYRLLIALKDHPDLKLGGWEVLVVDEYQDLNLCEISVFKQISNRGRCLVAVGDDDQSICSYRHAHPEGIRKFKTEDYPEAVGYTLSINHRCATSILKWARHVIEGLPGRGHRPVLTSASHCEPGEARYLRFENEKQEAEGVARLVKWLICSKAVEPEDIAVLFRSNNNSAWSKPLTQALEDMDIPVVNRDEVAEILSEQSNRRLLARARLVADQSDSLAWWTLLHLTSGIGSKVRDHFYHQADSTSKTFADRLLAGYEDGYTALTPAARGKVIDVVRPVLELIGKVDVSGADLRTGGWGSWLAQRSGEFGGCEARFRDLLMDLDQSIDRDEGLSQFLNQIEPVGKDLRSGRAAKAVRLMTMTSSKGLTVRAAIVVGVEEGVIPLEGRDLDEERRLLYVAMTRSTEFLYLTWSRRRKGPTARTGKTKVAMGRKRSRLVAHGPVQVQPGTDYLESIRA